MHAGFTTRLIGRAGCNEAHLRGVEVASPILQYARTFGMVMGGRDVSVPYEMIGLK
jgi:hypothetical protein